MLDLIEFEGGDILANLAERTITTRLLPYGEEGRTNLGRLTVDRGTVTVPADPIVVGLNTDHEPSAGVGRAVLLDDREDGIYATFTFARTPEGDRALADAASPTGRRRKMSAEFGPALIKAGRLVAGKARLWGAALVEEGAFPSAMVLAADTPDSDPAHLAIAADVLPEDVTVTTPTGDALTYEPPAAPAEDHPSEGEIPVPAPVLAAQPLAAQPPALVPSTVLAAAPPAAPVVTERPVALQEVFAAIAAVKSNPYDGESQQVLAALTDIKTSGATALPGAGVLRPNWVGQLYQGEELEREYITLGTLGTDITAAGKLGYTVSRGTAAAPVTGPPSGGDWAGDKAEVKSYGGFSATKSSSLAKFAVGNDIAREFYDLAGGAEVVEAFLRLLVEDHLTWSDTKALTAWKTAAGAAVAPSVPTAGYPAAVSVIIDGIFAVKKKKADGRRDTPTFAIVNELGYQQLVRTPYEQRPEYIRLDIGTDREGTADGIYVVQGDVGIQNTPAAIVGARRAIEFDELAGGPLKIDAIDLARGGIDKALHGYLQTFVARPEAVVLIGKADAA